MKEKTCEPGSQSFTGKEQFRLGRPLPVETILRQESLEFMSKKPKVPKLRAREAESNSDQAKGQLMAA